MNTGDNGRNDYQLALNDVKMLQHLPQLIMAVKTKWRDYQLDPNHDRIDGMRGEVELLLYWLSRQVVKSRTVTYRDQQGADPGAQANVTRRTVKMGAWKQITDLQHDVYGAVRERKTVTNLVEGATGDLVAYVARIVTNEKTDRYRRHQIEKKHVVPAEDLFPAGDDDEGRNEDAVDVLVRPEYAAISPEQYLEAYQCLVQFAEFLDKQQLNVELERVAWTLWMAGPWSDKHSGDISENTKNTDIALAREIGMPKKKFDRYKRTAMLLVNSFRQHTGW